MGLIRRNRNITIIININKFRGKEYFNYLNFIFTHTNKIVNVCFDEDIVRMTIKNVDYETIKNVSLSYFDYNENVFIIGWDLEILLNGTFKYKGYNNVTGKEVK